MSFSNISIIGISVFLDSKNSYLRRIVWFLLVSFGIVLSSYQVIQNVDTFLSEPMSIEQNYENNQKTGVKFPVVTLCPWRFLSAKWLKENAGDSIFEELLKEFKDQNSTQIAKVFSTNKVMEGMDKILNETLEFSSSGDDCTFGIHTCEDLMNSGKLATERIYLGDGACMSFKLRENATSAGAVGGFYFYLSTHDDDNFSVEDFIGNGYKVMVHDEDNVIISKYDQGVLVGAGSQVFVGIKITHYSDLPSKTGCVKDKKRSYSSCLYDCLTNYELEKCKCAKTAHVPNPHPCSTMMQFRCTAEATDEFIANGTLKAERCAACLRPCEYSVYDTSVSSMPISRKLADYYSYDNVSTTVALDVYLETMNTVHVFQNLYYTRWNLLSDIGGSLSLLLGATLYSILQAIEETGSFLIRRNDRN